MMLAPLAPKAFKGWKEIPVLLGQLELFQDKMRLMLAMILLISVVLDATFTNFGGNISHTPGNSQIILQPGLYYAAYNFWGRPASSSQGLVSQLYLNALPIPGSFANSAIAGQLSQAIGGAIFSVVNSNSILVLQTNGTAATHQATSIRILQIA
ncbi:hypothetical protein [Bacillus cereus]|uniref:hypothetical protein n=1 Tax=Bacillus cereus TaxID=1396 RepID=UPI001FCAB420|nr:hypothetical protein [Bacillus cereus]